MSTITPSPTAAPTPTSRPSAIGTDVTGADVAGADLTGTPVTGTSTPPVGSTRRYLAPDTVSRRVLNPLMAALVGLGVGARGGRILHVRGRRSGQWRTVPVNPLTLDGVRYLVAPRGHTEWVRNLRAAGSGRLQLGRRFEAFTATEIDDAAKAPVIRAYLERWSAETQRFFGDLRATSTDDEIAAVAAGFPVFRIDRDDDRRD